jgi:hypothetical protein
LRRLRSKTPDLNSRKPTALTGYGFSPIINPVGKIQVAQSREGQALEILKDLLGAADAETGVGSPDAEIDVVGPSGSGER